MRYIIILLLSVIPFFSFSQNEYAVSHIPTNLREGVNLVFRGQTADILLNDYIVTSVPESSGATLSNDRGGYTFLIKESPGMIQLSVVLELKTPIILPEEYAYIKGMFSEIVEKENKKIVLSKT